MHDGFENNAAAEYWLLPSGVPDWDAIDYDVPCGRCGYELRMLTEPRCPECGLAFSWAEVLATRFQEDPTLFEHQWRDRPVLALVATAWRTSRMLQFWRELSIHLATNRPGLIILALLNCLLWLAVNLLMIAGLGWFVAALDHVLKMYSELDEPPAIVVPRLVDAVGAWSDDMRFLRAMFGGNAAMSGEILAYTALFSGGILLALLTLWRTFRAYRIRSAHALRVMVYSLLSAIAWQPVALVVICLVTILGVISLGWPTHMVTGMLQLGILIPIIAIFSVYRAVKTYLIIPHAGLVAIVTGFVAVLFTMTVRLVFHVWL